MRAECRANLERYVVDQPDRCTVPKRNTPAKAIALLIEIAHTGLPPRDAFEPKEKEHACSRL